MILKKSPKIISGFKGAISSIVVMFDHFGWGENPLNKRKEKETEISIFYQIIHISCFT